jgi:hypothetical protein
MEKVSVVWMEDQTSHNIPLCHRLIQITILALFNTTKDERSENAAERSMKLAEVDSSVLRTKAVFIA